jgi:GAF domain-containing protein
LNPEESALAAEVARIAAAAGPAIAPAGHEELLRSITDAAKDLFAAAACSLALYEESTDELVFVVASGAGADEVIGLRVPSNAGIVGWVLNSGQPISIENVRTDPRFATDVAESTGYVPTAILAMPLETERATIGVIEVLDRSADGRDTARDMELLGLFARQAALAIENSRVFGDMGRALLKALAGSVEDADLADALRNLAAETSGPEAELVEVARLMQQLGAQNPAQRTLAINVLNEFLDFARSRWRI